MYILAPRFVKTEDDDTGDEVNKLIGLSEMTLYRMVRGEYDPLGRGVLPHFRVGNVNAVFMKVGCPPRRYGLQPSKQRVRD